MAKEQSVPQPIDTELIEPACADIGAKPKIFGKRVATVGSGCVE